MGDNTKIKITLYLLKYADPMAKYTELKDLQGKLVIFYPHADGQPLQNYVGTSMEMYVSKVELYYLTQDAFYDAVDIFLISSGYTSMTTIPQGDWGYGYTYGSYYGSGL